jgi:Domain of unknown function (DUF4350)
VRIGARTWAIAAVVVAIGFALWLRGTSSGDSPEHRTDSDAANGSSALPQLTSALGRQGTVLQDDFAVGPELDELFVLTPTRPFSAAETRRLRAWVSRGGVLVYAAEDGDPALDGALGVRRRGLPVSGDAAGAGPMLSGVARVSGAAAVRPFAPTTGQVGLLRSAQGAVTAYEEPVGRGRLVVLADPLPLCNGYLERADNGRFASDLISLAPTGGQVGFDEHHHAPIGIESPVTGLLSSTWGAGISWAVVVVFAGLALRGRRFGPRLQRPGVQDRSTADHVAAVGRLLAKGRAAGVTSRLLVSATRRSLAGRYGLGAAGPALDAALARRAPRQAAELARLEAELAADPGEGGLIAAAHRLHRLAHPVEAPPAGEVTRP